MNKKISLILSIFLSFIAIIIVSTYGIVPESLNAKIYIQELKFENVLIDSKTNAKSLPFNYKPNNNTIDLSQYVSYAPLDATDIGLIYTIKTDNPDDAKITSTGWLTIYNCNKLQYEITVTARDAGKKSDKLIIYKPTSNVQEFDEFEWG